MKKEITVQATISNVDTVTDFINEQLEAHDCSIKAQTQIDIAIDEIFANIANYAYGDGTGEATVSVEFGEEPDVVTISFADEGIPFNPLEMDAPDVTLSAEERKIGGLGIFIVRKTMNSVEYKYKDGKNILTIKKSIS